MSAAHPHNLDLMPPPITKTMQQRSLIIGVIFSIGAAIGAFLQPDVFIRGYLVSYMAWLGVTLGSMAILMLRHMTGGGWGMVIRRIMGAAMRCIWLMAILFLPIGLMMPRLYVWARPLDTVQNKHLREHLQDITHTYLNPQGFWIRAVIYFAIWGFLIFFLTKWSKEQDQPPVRDTSAKFKVLAGPGLILYGFTISFAAIDWVMSIDPSWISTIYGLLFLAGQGLSAMCFAVIIERILVRYKPMSELLKPDFVHDHGKLILTFVMIWAYFSFSQWLIIWAGNLPEEITWYMTRLHGGWQGMGLFLVIFHFAVPFVLLLSRPFKRDVTRLVWLAVWLMFMRWVDILWHIEPAFSATFTITWADVVLPIAMGGLWMAFFFRNLNSMPLLPAYDVYAKEVLEPAHE
jgi:multisubunit Na+/H+ antiporter MnhG subunit